MFKLIGTISSKGAEVITESVDATMEIIKGGRNYATLLLKESEHQLIRQQIEQFKEAQMLISEAEELGLDVSQLTQKLV